MREQWSTEALYALIFAVCVLLALLLLTSCSHKKGAAPELHPAVQGQSVVFPGGSPAIQRLAEIIQ